MNNLKIRGIVLKETNLKESDKIITVLTGTRGKLCAVAKGARRNGSRLAGGCQFLTFTEFVLFEGRELFSVNSCDVIEHFSGLKYDIEKLTYASHMTELVQDIALENQPSEEVLKLFLNTLHFLSNTNRNPELLIRIFELRLIGLLGFTPELKSCVVCGNIDTVSRVFSFEYCGMLCKEMHQLQAFYLSEGTYKALLHIFYSEAGKLFNFEVTERIIKELSVFSSRYINDRLEKKYCKLDFLNRIK